MFLADVLRLKRSSYDSFQDLDPLEKLIKRVLYSGHKIIRHLVP